MKKILFLTPNLGSGGAERQLVTISILLKEKGYDVDVLCYANGDFYAHLLKDINIDIIWQIDDNYLKRIIRVRRFIRKGDYDTVISFLETPNFLNNLSSIGGKTWKVITGERSAKKSTFITKRGKIFAWFEKFSDLKVCNSKNATNMWNRYYPQYTRKIITLYNPISLQEITSIYEPKKNDKLHIVIAASYQYLKNPIGLIKALILLNDQQRKNIEINWYGAKEVIKGNTQAYDESVNLIKENNLQDIIHLNGETKNITDMMNEADIVALFSSVEGLPNVICEGMMIGKPIIMTRVSDYDTLVDDTNGFLCDWNRIETIKDALLKAMELSKEELLQMGKNSKKKAEKLFSKEVITKQWIDVIEG